MLLIILSTGITRGFAVIFGGAKNGCVIKMRHTQFVFAVAVLCASTFAFCPSGDVVVFIKRWGMKM